MGLRLFGIPYVEKGRTDGVGTLNGSGLQPDSQRPASVTGHINSTSNPHSVTQSQVGLSAVTNAAQLTRAASDWQSDTGIAEETVPAIDDLVLIEDKSASYAKKKVQVQNLVTLGSARITPEGGVAVKLLNNTGSQINKGYVVKGDSGTDNAIVLAGASDIDPIGVAYADIPAGQSGWVVIGGRGEIYAEPKDSGTSPPGTILREEWVGMDGSTAGSGVAKARTSPPNQTSHFNECGHTLTGRSGTGLVFAIIHFN